MLNVHPAVFLWCSNGAVCAFPSPLGILRGLCMSCGVGGVGSVGCVGCVGCVGVRLFSI